MVDIQFVHQDLEGALFQLLDEAAVPLLFNNGIIPDKKIHLRFQGYTVRSILDNLLQDTGLRYRLDGDEILIETRPIPAPANKFVISGYIRDAASGERLIDAGVGITGTHLGTYTNEYGFFSIPLKAGKVELFVTHVGYGSKTIQVDLQSDTLLSFVLAEYLLLDQVTILDTGRAVIRLPGEWDLDKIDLQQNEYLPRLAGESDIIRYTHLLPGVQTGSDGVGGIFVRGGNAGHNLIMVDGVPVYNINHAAGLFSVFNPSVIKKAELLKGAFPARYGGRLSSVLDIRTKDGNTQHFSGQGELGLLTGRVLFEGPIQHDSSSFLLAGRWSFLNQYLEPRTRRYKLSRGEQGASIYDFYDFNAKFNYSLGTFHKLYFSYYRGADQFENFGDRSDNFSLRSGAPNELIPFKLIQNYNESINWGNEAAALRWNAQLSPKLFANTTLTYSSLELDIGIFAGDSLFLQDPFQLVDYGLNAAAYQSSIQDAAFKVDFDWHPSPKHYLRFGTQYRNFTFWPGILEYNEASLEFVNNTVQKNRSIHANELSVYGENSQQLSAAVQLNYGLRFASHYVDGRSYFSLEPRLAFYWSPNTDLTWKGAVRKTTQFLHLLSSSTIGLPTDLWVPSTGKLQPEKAWQFSLGADYALASGLNFQGEVYYKTMDRLLTYSEGVTFFDDWEKNVTSGKGNAYGLDVLLQKNWGVTTGWLAYSLAYANRQFDLINFGDPFPFQYDRRHSVKVAVVHRFSKKWSVSANWVFGTGLALSIPQESYTIFLPDGGSLPVTVVNFGRKNEDRLPAYHRLDIGANFEFEKLGVKHRFYAGLTNLYNRNNPLYYRLESDVVIQNNELRQVNQFVDVRLLPLLPSFNYFVKF